MEADYDQWFPVAYASRALLPYEKLCANRKRNLIDRSWSRRVLQNIFGRHFTVIYDHQPLKLNFEESLYLVQHVHSVVASFPISNYESLLSSISNSSPSLVGCKKRNKLHQESNYTTAFEERLSTTKAYC